MLARKGSLGDCTQQPVLNERFGGRQGCREYQLTRQGLFRS
jgi:hypothetical protein